MFIATQKESHWDQEGWNYGGAFLKGENCKYKKAQNTKTLHHVQGKQLVVDNKNEMDERGF